VISNLASTGLYYFRRADLFRSALDEARRAPSGPELYVAPLYNHLIAQGASIHYHLIGADQVIFCGTPAQYEALQASPPSGSQ
jgi:dTDP-glucose pyrophosphorylase